MKIAIVKLSAMGDIIHAMVVLEYIKKNIPNIEIDWVVESAFAPILEDNPNITRILPVNLKALKRDKKKLFSQIKLIKEYSHKNYDCVIDAQGLIKSAITSSFLSKNTYGFSKHSIREKVASYLYKHKIDIPYNANTIDRNAKIISNALGFDISSEDILKKQPFLYYKEDASIKKYLTKDKKNIIFVVGSTWESRNYPQEKFVQIAHTLQANTLVVWGNEEEYQKAKYIETHTPYAKAMPKINLNTLKALISQSDLLIGNDTGPTHMAWGLNIPSITIFGPTPTSRVYITPINKVIKSNSIVNPYKLNKNDYSIRDINPNAIINLAKELL